MAYISTSATVNIFRDEWGEFSGVGPFWVPDHLLHSIYDELTASGVTVTQWHQHESVIEINSSTGEWPVMNPRTQIVISAARLIPSANMVGATDNYAKWELLKYSTAPAVNATQASWSNTSGTALAMVKQSMGAITSATVAANERLTLKKSTTGSGLANPGMLLQIEFYEP